MCGLTPDSTRFLTMSLWSLLTADSIADQPTCDRGVHMSDSHKAHGIHGAPHMILLVGISSTLEERSYCLSAAVV